MTILHLIMVIIVGFQQFFVDIRESSKLFTDKDKEKVAKIIRSFTSEIIEILREDDNLREIGIRGDCVYAIYTTPKKMIFMK